MLFNAKRGMITGGGETLLVIPHQVFRSMTGVYAHRVWFMLVTSVLQPTTKAVCSLHPTGRRGC